MRQQNKPTLGFIGAGNMASALIGGLVQKGYPADQIYVSDPHEEKCQLLAKQFSIRLANNNQACVEACEVIVLAIKPQKMTQCLESLALPTASRLWISVATGVTFETYAHYLKTQPVIRVMPNTPCLVGEGASAMVANTHATDSDKTFAKDLMSSVSQVVWCDTEDHLNIVTGISGSGPAYFFYFMEALVAKAIAEGLPDDIARQLVIQTAFGAATMTKADNDIGALKNKVTAKGGTTAAALEAFDAHGMSKAVEQGVCAAIKRARELSEQGN